MKVHRAKPRDELEVAEAYWHEAAARLAAAHQASRDAKAAEKRAQEDADQAWSEYQMVVMARRHG